ncbi:hypothetical protein DFJ58DRAFT_883665, partial [Suillus subalutaceus]|uniref:uncharacterized protein n=1 Tax=Suillus subalutaceus TaxID=48586 RepID=UPI001B881F46
MIGLLFHEKNMSVAKSVMMSYFTAYEPDLVRQRKARRLKWKCFWAASVNDLFAVDQHNKWLRFGLGLHTGIEPFLGRIIWIRVWHSNRNPQLILSYYLDAIAELGHMPLITQSNLGTKNYGIANAQTLLHQHYDPTLQGTLQHRWMCTKKNVMPEITWSQLQHRFTPGFESLLDEGVTEGWYDSGNTLHTFIAPVLWFYVLMMSCHLFRMVFRWVFIPWLQQELNTFRDQVNNSAKRCDRNKVLPHGVLNLIYDSPEDFGVLDFKVFIDRDSIDYICDFYINASNPAFDLVPPMLGEHIEHCYDTMGRPTVTQSTVWTVYRNVLSAVQSAENPHPDLL